MSKKPSEGQKIAKSWKRKGEKENTKVNYYLFSFSPFPLAGCIKNLIVFIKKPPEKLRGFNQNLFCSLYGVTVVVAETGFAFSFTAAFPSGLLPPRSTNIGAATKIEE